MPLVSKNFADFDAHNKDITTIAWSKQGNSLASGSEDCSAKLWNVEHSSGPRSTCQLTGHDGPISTMAWLSEHTIATCGEDKNLKIWDARSGRCNHTVQIKGAKQLYMRCSPDNSVIAMGNGDDTITFVDTKKWKVRHQRDFHPVMSNEFFFHPNGRHIFIAMGRDSYNKGMMAGEVEIMEWNQKATGDVTMTKSHTIRGHNAGLYCMNVDPTGRFFATGAGDSIISVWDAKELICLRSHGRLEGPVRGLNFSYDGKYLASSAINQPVDIMNVETGAHEMSVETGISQVTSLAWHPKRLLLALTGDTQDARDTRSSPATIKIVSLQSQK